MNLFHLWLACATPVGTDDTADSGDTADTGDPVDCPDAMSNEEFGQRWIDAYCAWFVPCATADYTLAACAEQYARIWEVLEPDRCRMDACLAELALGTCESMSGEDIASCQYIWSDKDE